MAWTPHDKYVEALVAKKRKDYISDIDTCIKLFSQVETEYAQLCQDFLALVQDSPIRPLARLTKWRTKDAERLKAKLLRKAIDQAGTESDLITLREFFTNTGITDLGGVRLVHLVKSEWLAFHEFLAKMSQQSSSEFKIIEVTANVRPQEEQLMEDTLTKKKIPFEDSSGEKPANGDVAADWEHMPHVKIRVRETGYASFHYLLESTKKCIVVGCGQNPTAGAARYVSVENCEKSANVTETSQPSYYPMIIEVQVRSLVEEGWGEIQHGLQYKPAGPPDDLDRELKNQLAVLNNIAALFDETAGHLRSIERQPKTLRWKHLAWLIREMGQTNEDGNEDAVVWLFSGDPTHMLRHDDSRRQKERIERFARHILTLPNNVSYRVFVPSTPAEDETIANTWRQVKMELERQAEILSNAPCWQQKLVATVVENENHLERLREQELTIMLLRKAAMHEEREDGTVGHNRVDVRVDVVRRKCGGLAFRRTYGAGEDEPLVASFAKTISTFENKAKQRDGWWEGLEEEEGSGVDD